MKIARQYAFEYALLAAVMVVSVLGFWNIYFGARADPQLHHHLHVLTTFVWLGLLFFQLGLIGKGRHGTHRRVGLSVLFVAPLLVATTAMLSVHSAHNGLVSGQGDFLIVQNVGVTLELSLLILLALVLRKRRKLHASLLLSTTVLFLGIALFFTLINFVPELKIEGPETFHRFQTAAITGQAICLVVGLVFLVKDFSNGWPFLLAGMFFVLNEAIRSLLTTYDLIDPLTEAVGSLSQPLTFVGSFAVFLALLAASGLLGARRVGAT